MMPLPVSMANESHWWDDRKRLTAPHTPTMSIDSTLPRASLTVPRTSSTLPRTSLTLPGTSSSEQDRLEKHRFFYGVPWDAQSEEHIEALPFYDVKVRRPAPPPQAPKHSVFTLTQKRLIVFTASCAALFSPMTSTIYFPALNLLSHDLGVSSAHINLTISTYLIFQGITPTFIAAYSDASGRRLAYVVSFSIYLVANIALALQDSYAALMVLRCVQSAGSSATVALAQAVVADVATSAERGSYIAFTSVASILGPSVSPVVGGLLSAYLGWKAIFWFLTIIAGVFLIPLILFFPETCRAVVGDGSIPPPRASYNLPTWLRERRLAAEGQSLPKADERDRRKAARRMRVPNPIRILRVLLDPETAIILLNNALLQCCFASVTTTLPSQFARIYGYGPVKIGLIYLPLGLGGILSACTTGKIINWNYARYAKAAGLPPDRSRQHNLQGFPIERARLGISLPLAYIGCGAIVGFGWAVHVGAYVAIPCVCMFILGYCFIAGANCINILLVDIYPGRVGLASSANNLTRCLFAAGGSGFIIPLTNAVGLGWTCTILAMLWAVSTPGLWVLMMYGPQMRVKRKAKEDAKKAAANPQANPQANPPATTPAKMLAN